MTIIYHGQYRNLECEECGEELQEFHKDDFDRMIADARARDWNITNDRGEWHHFCGSCALADDRDPVSSTEKLLGVSRRPKAPR